MVTNPKTVGVFLPKKAKDHAGGIHFSVLEEGITLPIKRLGSALSIVRIVVSHGLQPLDGTNKILASHQ